MACTYITATWVDFNALTALQKNWLISEAYVDSLSTVRSSLNGLKLLLSWDDSFCLAEVIGLSHTDYSCAQMLVEVATGDWLSTVGI